MVLDDVLRNIDGIISQGALPTNLQIDALAEDSREVTDRVLFFAVPGTKVDGTKFAIDAVRRGAVAVVGTEALKSLPELNDIPLICVTDVRAALATCAANFYSHPSLALEVYGVTGTNGKTSSCWLLTELLAALGKPCAQLGTLGTRTIGNSFGMTREFQSLGTTTPGPIILQRYLSEAVQEGAKAAAFEVSSHAMEQHRCDGIAWDCAIFTNLTHDHLDYHGSFENYYAAKERLFTEELPSSAKSHRVAVVNVDDNYGVRLAKRLGGVSGVELRRWSVHSRDIDAVVTDVSYSAQATELSLKIFGESVRLRSQLIGGFNLSNITGVVLALAARGFALPDIAEVLPNVPPVPGRLELVAPHEISIFVDYAHTPDGLICAQDAIRGAAPGRRLITVFGCGGSRDRAKRPVMGRAVAERSDVAIVTSDNPREEAPNAIIDDILPGMISDRGQALVPYEIEPDRAKAIRRAIAISAPGDVILVAGKGHEDYQEINGVRFPFSDREQCLMALKEKQ